VGRLGEVAGDLIERRRAALLLALRIARTTETAATATETAATGATDAATADPGAGAYRGTATLLEEA
jgi:hypothetical protein